jgi:hypothetical protein
LRGDLLFSLQAWLGDNARKGAVKKRTQLKGKVSSKPAGTKRNKTSGELPAVKKSTKGRTAREDNDWHERPDRLLTGTKWMCRGFEAI